jgi:hypothetical protein
MLSVDFVNLYDLSNYMNRHVNSAQIDLQKEPESEPITELESRTDSESGIEVIRQNRTETEPIKFFF